MICYLPEIYEDETIYSWMGRYYAHSGYPCYVHALEDLMENRINRIDPEFMGNFNQETKMVMTSMYPVKDLILQHTMFPQYARFTSENRKRTAWQQLMSGQGDVHQSLPYSTNREGKRYICYCSDCAKEDREQHGEAYFHRRHLIRGIGICTKHRCRLHATKIEISGKQSPRLYVPEEEIPYPEEDQRTEYVEKSKDTQFAEYMEKVFEAGDIMNQKAEIGSFLSSKLEGTGYLFVAGKQKHISELFLDLTTFFQSWGNTGYGITRRYQLEKILGNRRADFYEVCQLGFFLKLPVEQLCNPELPQVSQAELFEQRVKSLKAQGLDSDRIAKEMGIPKEVALYYYREKIRAEHDHSVRKGMHREDWKRMDKEMVSEVRVKCKEIYTGNGGRPARVTEAGITRIFGWPGKRMIHLPKCRAIIAEYQEEIEHYWARECVWAFGELQKEMGEQTIYWKHLRNKTNLRKGNFLACFPYLEKFAEEETVERIRELA